MLSYFMYDPEYYQKNKIAIYASQKRWVARRRTRMLLDGTIKPKLSAEEKLIKKEEARILKKQEYKNNVNGIRDRAIAQYKEKLKDPDFREKRNTYFVQHRLDKQIKNKS